MNETYEEILTAMQNKFSELAGYSADNASDIGIRLRVLAGELFAINSNITWLNNQMFPQTATGNQLDYHATQRGISRKSATKACGELKFSVASALSYDVTIPTGTICATYSEDSTRYQTTQEAVITAGDLSVSVPAEAQEGGVSGNCLQNLITVIVTPPPGISSVTNETEFTGGSDAETDEYLRKRLLESYSNISNGTNCAFYKQEVLKNKNVTSASVISRPRGSGSLDVYIWSTSGSPSSALIAQVEAELNQIKEVNVDIEVLAPTEYSFDMSLSVVCEDGYTFSVLKPIVENTIRAFVGNLGIGEKLYISRLGEKILAIPGIKSYASSTGDKTVTSTKIASVGTITITEGN